MELDELKTIWKDVEVQPKTAQEIKTMLSENKHPVLEGIRKQLTIEIIGWSAFLGCYYTMFDGENKPVFINMLLVLAVMLPIVHNLAGYRFAKYLVLGNTIKESLQNYLSKVKIYSLVSIASRVLYFVGLLLFFTYNIHFNTYKYLLLGGAIVVFIVQLTVLYKLWAKRLKSLDQVIASFN